MDRREIMGLGMGLGLVAALPKSVLGRHGGAGRRRAAQRSQGRHHALAGHTAGRSGRQPAAHPGHQSRAALYHAQRPCRRPGRHSHHECVPCRPSRRFGHDPGAGRRLCPRDAGLSKAWTWRGTSMPRASPVLCCATGCRREGWQNRSDVPLQDAQRAMRLVRANAGKYGIDPARIGFMGFSAGGHVACSIATRFAAKVYAPLDAADTADARPSFSVPMYPVVTMGAGAHQGSRDRLIGLDPSAELVDAYSCEKHVPSRRAAHLLWRWPPTTPPCRRCPMRGPISRRCRRRKSPPRCICSKPAAMALALRARQAGLHRPGLICCCTGAPATASSKALKRLCAASQRPAPRAARRCPHRRAAPAR